MALLIAGILMTSCKTMKTIPDSYNFTVKESRGNPYGCWTVLNINSLQNGLVHDTIAGEFVCMDADTIYLLVGDRIVRPIYSGSVLNAQLYTHKNQAGTYFTITSLFLVPNLIGSVVVAGEFAGDILLLGIPMAVVGITHIIIESSAHRNILNYPGKNILDEFKMFARFPAGKPSNIDLNQLMLKPRGK